MALPFLAPLLIGATIGAITNPEDRLRGALLGGTLGALTGGLGATAAGGAGATQGALSAATAPTLQSGLGAAATEAGKASAKRIASNAVVSTASGASSAGANAAARAAGKIAAKDAAAKAASQAAINSAKVGAPIDIAQIAARTPTLDVAGATRDLAQIAAETPALDVAGPTQKLSGLDKAKAIVKDKPFKSAQFAQSVLGGGQQQQAPVVQMAPIQQGSFGMPMSREERLAMAGGDAPSFVPKGLFDQVNADLDEEERLRLLSQELQMAGMV